MHLPYIDLAGLSNYTAPAMLVGRQDINLFGHNLGDDAIVLNGMHIRDARYFSLSGISDFQIQYGDVPMRYGNHCGALMQVNAVADSGFTWDLSANTNVANEGYKHSILQGTLGYNRKLGKLNVELLYAGRVDYQNDFDPTQGTHVVLTASGNNQNNSTVLRPTGVGFGYYQEAQFIGAGQMREVAVPHNAGGVRSSHYGKVALTSENGLELSLHHYYAKRKGNDAIYENQLFNAMANPKVEDVDHSSWVQFRKTFNSSKLKPFVAVQVGAQLEKNTIGDLRFRDDLWQYGWVGEFEHFRQRTYEVMTDSLGNIQGFAQTGWEDTLVTFWPSFVHPGGIYNYEMDYLSDGEDFSSYLRNGESPASIYNLWNSRGQVHDQYYESDERRFNARLETGITLGKHQLEVGAEWNQWRVSYYNINPNGLWTLARAMTNYHISELDYDNPTTYQVGSNTFVDYDQLYNASAQFEFDRNLREALGYAVDGTDWINVDALSPNELSIAYFSGEEVSSITDYQGYDYKGERLTGNVDAQAYFTDLATIAPYQPIYMGFYAHDNFQYGKFTGNVGVRLDYFNPNQMALEDPYVWYAANTVDNAEGGFDTPPTTVPNDAVVYVNDVDNPTAVNGYRDGDTWYNADGVEISDPSVIQTASGMAPWLVNPDAQNPTDIVLKEVEPVWNILPQVHLFYDFAQNGRLAVHHQSSTQNPLAMHATFRPDQLVHVQNTNGILNNPELAPMRTTFSSVELQWMLPKSVRLSLEGFRTESDNNVAVVERKYAYPSSYFTYENVSGNTLYGFAPKLAVLNASSLVSFQFQYVKQFGSVVSFSYAEDNFGAHTLININKLIGSNYKANNGAFFSAGYNYRSGGSRYSSTSVYPAAMIGASSSQLTGTVNNQELPSMHTISLRLEKEFPIKSNGITAYAQVENLFFNEQIVNVYSATGEADDDGYLSEPAYQAAISQQVDEQAFRDQYEVKVDNPYNYGAPTVIRIGVIYRGR